MARYHVRADGSMGICSAKEGNCPFGGEEGTRHFTNEADATRYAEQMVRAGKGVNGGLKRSSSNGGGSKPPSTPSTAAGTADDDPNGRWIGKDLSQAVSAYVGNKDFMDSMTDVGVYKAVEDVAKVDPGVMVPGAASTPEESMNLDKIGRLAAAMRKNESFVRDMAIKNHSEEPGRTAVISALGKIADATDDKELGLRARNMQADLAWRRDGEPYYPEWEATHKDEAFYDGEPALEIRPFGPKDMTEDEMIDAMDDLEAAMSEVQTQMDYVDRDLGGAVRYEEFENVGEELMTASGGVEEILMNVDEISNPDYWDSEPDETKREYGKMLQEARRLVNRADDYSGRIEDMEYDWLRDNPSERKRSWDDAQESMYNPYDY